MLYLLPHSWSELFLKPTDTVKFVNKLQRGAGIAGRDSALDRLSLLCAAIITMRVRTLACAPKQGNLPHFLHLWTEV